MKLYNDISEVIDEKGIKRIKRETNIDEYDLQEDICYICNEKGFRKDGFQSYNANVYDIDKNNEIIHYIFRLRRFKCKHCGMVEVEKIDIEDGMFNCTERLLNAIWDDFLQKPIKYVTNKYQFSKEKIYKIIDYKIKENECKILPKAPEILGISRFAFKNETITVLSNANYKEISILNISNGNFDRIIKIIKQMDEINNIKFIGINLVPEFRNKLNEEFPNINMVVDRSVIEWELENISDHVYNMYGLNNPLYEEVNRLRTKLDSFYKVVKNKEFAFDKWLCQAEALNIEEISNLTLAMKELKSEIFEWFNIQKLECYSKSIKDLMNAFIKRGRPYTFERLRAKILHNEKAKYPEIKKGLRHFDPSTMSNMFRYENPYQFEMLTGYRTKIFDLLYVFDNKF